MLDTPTHRGLETFGKTKPQHLLISARNVTIATSPPVGRIMSKVTLFLFLNPAGTKTAALKDSVVVKSRVQIFILQMEGIITNVGILNDMRLEIQKDRMSASLINCLFLKGTNCTGLCVRKNEPHRRFARTTGYGTGRSQSRKV